jgi:hypothetical protein
MGQPFGPGIEDDHVLPSGCPARSRDACREPGRPPGRNGMDNGLDLRASHFSDLVIRGPRREDQAHQIAWPSLRRSPPGSLRKAVNHQGEWRRAPAHTLARKNTSITDHNVGLLPPVQTGYASRSPRDLNFKACPKKVSSSSNLSVIATTPRHACNWSTCRST